MAFITNKNGGGIASDYNGLDNQPSINGFLLRGNKTSEQLGMPNVKVNNVSQQNFNFIGQNDTITQLNVNGLLYNFQGQKGDKGDAGTASVAIDDSTINAQQTWSSGKIKSQLDNIDSTTIKGIEVTTNAQTDGKNITFGHSTNAIANDVSTSVIIGGGSTGYNNVIGGDGANVNKLTPNTTTTGTQAHVSVVGGYDNSAGSLSSKIISDHSKTEIGGNGHNAIYGGANHVCKSTASFAMIAGGQTNEVSGYGGFVTGIRNKCGGQGSAVFGYDNDVNSNGGFICGAGNIIKTIFGTAFGSTNLIELGANFATVFGNFGIARFVGQQVFTAGKLSTNGDAQTTVMEMHKQTTTGVGTVLGVLGSGSSYKLQPNQSVMFNCMIIARDVATTDSASFKIEGMARRGATGNSVIVNPVITTIAADTGASLWRINSVTGASDGSLNVTIVGEDGKTIKWVMRMTLVEVTA